MNARLVRLLVWLVLWHLMPSGGGAHVQPDSTWTKEALNALAEEWPGNVVQGFPEAAVWKPNGGGRLCIVQLGDSHIQGDFICAATRQYISEACGFTDVARGYAFPFGVLASNEPSDIQSRASNEWTAHLATRESVVQSLGLSAAALVPSSRHARLTVGLRPDLVEAARASELTVLFTPSRNVAVPIVNGEAPRLFDRRRGVAVFPLPPTREEIVLSFKSKSSQSSSFRLLGMVFDNPTSRFVFHGGGCNGAKIGSILLNRQLPFLLEYLAPTIIVLSLGTNDCYAPGFNARDFKRDYEYAAAKIQRACPKAVIVLTTPPDHLYNQQARNPRVEEAVGVVRDVASRQGYALWDCYAIMGGRGSRYSWLMHELSAKDGVHFTPTGYRLLGRMFAVALLRALEGKGGAE